MSQEDLRATLTQTLFELTSIPSPIGEERALCDAIQTRFAERNPRARIERFHDSLLVRLGGEGPRVGLVGHLDTVRTLHDGPVRIEGDKLYGAGASDMKSGLAVMVALAERVALADLRANLTLVFYEREEGPFDENRLGPMINEYPELGALDLAICLEPSDNKLQLGCMGSMHAGVVFEGRTSHSARPWQGENAITKSASFLADLGALQPNLVTIDGFEFREVMSATLAQGGRGRNVIPDVFDVNVNYRFAPGRSVPDAERVMRELVGNRARVEIRDRAPSARPHASHPLVKELAGCGVKAIEVKQAWTDVARFDAIGVPAVNFGPGSQAQAHQRNEWTDVSLLPAGYSILETFLTRRA